MHWIIQDGMYREEGVLELLDTLERFEIRHDVVSTRGGVLSPDIAPEGPVMVCGTYSMARIAARMGWTPGSFHNANHDHRAWASAYGEDLLNADAVTLRLADVDRPWDRFFIRPCEDSKAFSGQVIAWDGFREWRDRGIERSADTSVMGPNTLVLCAPVQAVYTEARFFVVDGSIAASTTYRVGRNVVADPDVSPQAEAFARLMVVRWTPARAFVLDVALADSGWRVVEINCINCSGFYGANVPRIVAAIEDMGF